MILTFTGSRWSDLKCVAMLHEFGSGPLLFLLCINDICNASDKFHFFLFADDTIILGTHKKTQLVYTQVSREFVNLQNCFS